MARAKMKSLLVIRDIIQSSSNNDLKRLFAWVLGESRVIASWAAREMGDHSEARRIAFAALTTQPASARAWRALGAALKPNCRQRKNLGETHRGN